MLNPANLCIDQLLRAAQLLEQQQQSQAAAALQIKLMTHQQQQQQDQTSMFCKLGEGYEERMVSPKMRLESGLTLGLPHHQPVGSTGSSRRSSPISSGMFSSSNCSSASPPNSPPSSILINNLPASSSSSSSFQTMNINGQVMLPNKSNNHQQPSSGNRSPGSVGSVSTRQSRAAHNELEKNRRANLRGYLDKLKTVLPADVDSTRDTTLSLLTRARNYLITIHQKKEQLLEQRNALVAEHIRLCSKLEETEPTVPTIEQEQQAQPLASPMKAEPIEEQEQVISPLVPAPMEVVSLASPTTFLGIPLNLGEGSASAFSTLNIKQTTTAVDFCMDGLLPVLPLLYPYTNQTSLSC